MKPRNAPLFSESEDQSEKLKPARTARTDTKFSYDFENFFHPFVGELIEKLNKESLPGLLDAKFHQKLEALSSSALEGGYYERDPEHSDLVEVVFHDKKIDLDERGPYANYNWELFYDVPLTIAVHLSKNQRFAEAQRWFHYIFDPTCNDTSIPRPERYWKFLRFRRLDDVTRIDELLRILSTPDGELDSRELEQKELAWDSLKAIRNHPFQPHAVARMRHVAYQYSVVMKYLDNLIAWGDSLFRQDTIETINEATQLYVLAANILGERPQRIPPRGVVKSKSFRQLRTKLGPMGNALVELEGKFPFNLGLPTTRSTAPDDTPKLFGIGQALYFCVPPNEKLLGYWDLVADRLFKIRHCMNIEGVVRQLALFDPPLDPGMLVKATAAGIDVTSIIGGLNQPIGPVRSLFLIQKALELAGEVRGLGGALLSAIEKGDSERLTLLRQGHEIKIQENAKGVRFLQWKQAQESTESLLRSRASVLERYRFYLRLLGKESDSDAAPDTLEVEHPELTEDNFEEVFSTLVGQYDKDVALSAYPEFETKEEGRLHLHKGEYDELNKFGDRAHAARLSAAGAEAIAAASVYIPDFEIKLAYWGLGSSTDVPVGRVFQHMGRALSTAFSIWALIEEESGRNAAKTASYERRADDWVLQANLAARELMQIGRQILGSLIAEQIAYLEYQNIQKQIEQSQEVERFLHDKFSNEVLYTWMQGEITRLYYEYYRFAFDTARQAERTMKHELMRPELDTADYIKFNYWDGGRKGLLSGEALYLNIKRMEMAYHENNKREYELTKHLSLRQINPFCLLTLKATGSCEVIVPEWLFDLDAPGHYMRRIKNVSLSIPAVTGPYTSLNCTLSLLKSSLRKLPLLKDGEYARQGSEDDRFVDYFVAVESIVTSRGNDDSGMFETSLRDEKFLPFEGHGVIGTWKLELPKDFRQFDYDTISDVILHVRYTARQGGTSLGEEAVNHLHESFEDANSSGLVHLLSLKQDFPTEWHRFVTDTSNSNFVASVKRDYFSYFSVGRKILIAGGDIQVTGVAPRQINGPVTAGPDQDIELTESVTEFELSLAESEALARSSDVDVFVLIKYALESS